MLRVLGTEGRIEVADFWFASRPRGRRRPHRGDPAQTALPRTVEVGGASAGSTPSRPTRRRRRSAPAGRSSPPPGMSWDDTLGNLRVLDKWRADAGLVLRHRARRGAAAHDRGTLPLERRAEAIPHRRARRASSESASVLALGFEDFPDFASASILLDAFFERGGNVLDTAWVYRSGRTEAVLGEWLRARGVRDEVVVIGKGAHSPLTYPDVIGRQLDREPRPARHRPRRRLLHAPRQPGRPGRRVRRRDRRRAAGGADPRPDGAARTGRASASTRRSPTPSGPARRGRPRSRTTSRSPRCSTRSGPAASRPPTTPGRRG